MADTIGGLKSAVEYRIPCVELRYEPTSKLPLEDVKALLKEWRAVGGKSLSLHAPSINPEEAGDGIVGVDDVKAASELAVDLGCQAVTMHVPHNHPVGKVVGQFRDRLLDAYADGLSPLKEAGKSRGGMYVGSKALIKSVRMLSGSMSNALRILTAWQFGFLMMPRSRWSVPT